MDGYFELDHIFLNTSLKLINSAVAVANVAAPQGKTLVAILIADRHPYVKILCNVFPATG